MPDPQLVDRGLDKLKADKEAMGEESGRLLAILMSNRQIQAMVVQYVSNLRIQDAIVAAMVAGYFLRDKVSVLEMERTVDRLNAGGLLS